MRHLKSQLLQDQSETVGGWVDERFTVVHRPSPMILIILHNGQRIKRFIHLVPPIE